MKKNNTAQKTVLEAQEISKALKEGTEKTLQNLIKEAISDIVDGETEEDEPIDDDSYDVQDVETDDTSVDNADDNADVDDTDAGEEDATSDEEGDGADDEWSDMEDYKVGDNDYDFTGVDGETALKVYNKLGDDDQIFVKKEDDGTYSVKDNESGAEFVIELDPEGENDADAEGDIDVDTDTDDSDIEGGDTDFEDDGDTEFEIDMDTDEDDLDGEDEADDDNEEIEVDLDSDSDNEEELNENLGYTDSYQKDVMPGLNMKEPADKKSTYGMDGGAPEGNSKPWAGKGDSKPFDEKTKELDEGTNVGGAVQQRSTSKSNIPSGRKEQGPKVKHNVSAAGEETAQINESKIRKIVEAAKAIQAENKQYQQVIGKIKQSLYEAAVLNMNYGKIVNLLVNETTTKQEKLSIVERFNSVKTINEGKQLYDSIKRELTEGKTKSAPLIDEQISANSSKTINETTIFQQNASNNASISLMERMDNLFKNKRK